MFLLVVAGFCFDGGDGSWNHIIVGVDDHHHVVVVGCDQCSVIIVVVGHG